MLTSTTLKGCWFYAHVIKVEGEGEFPIEELSCHLDPDVRYETYTRKSGWKGIFGQAGSALSHLTKEGQTRSRWLLPEYFRNYKISYHSENSWKDDYFQSAAKGQEFVVDGDENLEKWLKSLFS